MKNWEKETENALYISRIWKQIMENEKLENWNERNFSSLDGRNEGRLCFSLLICIVMCWVKKSNYIELD